MSQAEEASKIIAKTKNISAMKIGLLLPISAQPQQIGAFLRLSDTVSEHASKAARAIFATPCRCGAIDMSMRPPPRGGTSCAHIVTASVRPADSRWR